MTDEQSRLVLAILARLEPYFAADDIRPCRYCGIFVHNDPTNGKVVEHASGCVVLMIRQLKQSMEGPDA